MIKATLEYGRANIEASGSPISIAAELGAFTCTVFDRLMETAPDDIRGTLAHAVLSGIGQSAQETMARMNITLPDIPMSASQEAWAQANDAFRKKQP